MDQDKFVINSKTGELSNKAVLILKRPRMQMGIMFTRSMWWRQMGRIPSARELWYMLGFDEPTIVLNGQNVINYKEGMPLMIPVPMGSSYRGKWFGDSHG